MKTITMQKKNYLVETFTPYTITDRQKEKLEILCNLAYSIDEPAHENYDVNDWQNKPHTTLNLFYRKKRFDIFSIVSVDSKPVAMSGTYLWKGTPIIGVRAFTHPDYRGGGHWCQARNIFPVHIDYWDSKGYDKIWLTFNEYNHRLVNFLRRMSEGRASTFGGPREIYQNLKWYEETKEIQYTPQIVAELEISRYREAHSS